MASINGFVHRFHDDGTVDSICRRCFVTVAIAQRESELLAPENLHMCKPDVLSRFERRNRTAEELGHLN
jgi:hypothetical protein